QDETHATARPVTHAPILQLREIHKRFPGVHALRGVNLGVHPGEVHHDACCQPAALSLQRCASCHVHAWRTIVSSSAYWHVHPRISRARAGAATSSAGSPALRADSTTGTRLPLTRATASTTSRTERPRPVPRLMAWLGSPLPSRSSARECASARSITCM